MKLIVLVVAFATVSLGQIPPWAQMNPYFNGQLPVHVPAKDLSFLSTIVAKNNTNPFASYWGGFPFFQFFQPGTGGRFRRAVGEPYPPYYNPSGSCIPANRQCNGNADIGCRTSPDKTLFAQRFVKEGRWYSKREKVFRYPTDFIQPGVVYNVTVTAVWVRDMHCNGTAERAKITPVGNVPGGFRAVTIELSSIAKGKGFDYYVEIFGRQ